MSMNQISIPVQLDAGDFITIDLVSEQGFGIVEVDKADADANGEAPYQIFEGSTYEYLIEGDYQLVDTSGIVRKSKLDSGRGRIIPGSYVGTISISIANKEGDICGDLRIEVQSTKTDYRTDYRNMLEDITDWCTELLLQYTSPATQHFTVDFNSDASTLYQRFAFIQSLLESREFKEAIYRIIVYPAKSWTDNKEEKDIRSIKRVSRTILRQLTSSRNRVKVPQSHSLSHTISTVPRKVIANSKTETVDTPENQFIKYALTTFRKIVSDFKLASKKGSRLKEEAKKLESYLEEILAHDLFSDISHPDALPLNSPLLQRREGYREVLRAWLMFDLAAKLSWRGGDDVYEGGKRDVATLYEYWLFFKLLDIVEEVFKIEAMSVDNLIEETSDHIGLKLKQGNHLPIKGIFDAGTRKLNVDFSFNRMFKGNQAYPNEGSWSESMRPDYTLSVWPLEIDKEEAEWEELIVHIHFDAKYKIDALPTLFGEKISLTNTDERINLELTREKEEQKQGIYKRADLLKMHAYKDSIRRTAGAYILYPGDKVQVKKGFHEIIPGLGAFAVRPSKGDDGTEGLKKFLKRVVKHFLDRTSQREKISYHIFDTYKSRPTQPLNEPLPEVYGPNRALIPDATSVLVAYYKNAEHFEWIIKNELYNLRIGSNRGSIRLGPEETGATYLLLHTLGETQTDKIFKVVEEGPRVFSKDDLIKKDYPNPTQDFYLTFKVKPVQEGDLSMMKWDITNLSGYRRGRGSSLPFTANLAELARAKID